MTPELEIDRDGLAGRIAGLPGFEAVREAARSADAYLVGGAVRDALLGREPDRSRPGRRRRPPGARPGARRRASRARPVRHRDGHGRGTHRGRRPRSRRVISVSGRAARGPAGWDRRGPLASRLQRQRDGRGAERPRRADRPSGRGGGPATRAAARPARALARRRPDARAAGGPLRRAAGPRARGGNARSDPRGRPERRVGGPDRGRAPQAGGGAGAGDAASNCSTAGA